MKKLLTTILVAAYIILLIPSMMMARPMRVAVAANAQHVCAALQVDFKKRTGINVEIISGSSGKLAAQIRNGAPYDVFLSADMAFAQTLYQEGFALSAPKEYASGSLIVCSGSITTLKNWRKLIGEPGIQQIAIANPALAPYGKAAEQALRKYGLWTAAGPKLVLGESIAQVNTYITTGTVSLGFTTEALVHEYTGGKLNWLRVDPSTYDKIRQGALLLSYSKKGNYAQALRFYNYLSSASAKQLFRKHGYQVPSP